MNQPQVGLDGLRIMVVLDAGHDCSNESSLPIEHAVILRDELTKLIPESAQRNLNYHRQQIENHRGEESMILQLFAKERA